MTCCPAPFTGKAGVEQNVMKESWSGTGRMQVEQHLQGNPLFQKVILGHKLGRISEQLSQTFADCCSGRQQWQINFILQVIEVKANGRTGELNFVSCLRQILEKHYGEKPVGMGGTFVIQKGKAKIHIMVSCSQFI